MRKEQDDYPTDFSNEEKCTICGKELSFKDEKVQNHPFDEIHIERTYERIVPFIEMGCMDCWDHERLNKEHWCNKCWKKIEAFIKEMKAK